MKLRSHWSVVPALTIAFSIALTISSDCMALQTATDGVEARTYYENRREMLASRELPAAGKPGVVLFVNVNVIPMTSELVLRDRAVLVRGERIAVIAAEDEIAVPKHARIVDGGNGYLLPGLADMHVHSNGNPLSLLLFLANGVTTVREMSGRPEYLGWARQVEAGTTLAPAVYTTGPVLGGHEGPAEDRVQTAADARRRVEAQFAAGYRMIKPYTFLPAEAYRAAVSAARAKDMYVVGHIPYSVGTAGIIDAGQDEVAHVHSFHPDFFRGFDPDHTFHTYSIDDSFIARAIPRLEAAGIAVTTTLVVNQALADSQEIDRYLSRPEQAYATPGAAAYMRSTAWTFDDLWPHEYLVAVYLPYLYRLTAALEDAGVPLILGTDSGAAPGLIHGYSTHEELELLVRAGLTPFEALRTATRNAAAVVDGQDEWGAVETGMRADLVLLEGNPLEEIASTREIAGVMKAGRWLPRERLDELLAEVRRSYR